METAYGIVILAEKLPQLNKSADGSYDLKAGSYEFELKKDTFPIHP